MNALAGFVGEWAGGGHGDYPTIDAFRYTEETRFVCNGVDPMLQFEQRTWRDGKRDDPLHWEAGFLRALPAMELVLASAQNGKRVELLRGRIESSAGSTVLTLDSTLLGNDERLIRTHRRYECVAETLRYQVWMATRKVPELTLHLEARLARRTPEPRTA
jgi:hypothetical protein